MPGIELKLGANFAFPSSNFVGNIFDTRGDSSLEIPVTISLHPDFTTENIQPSYVFSRLDFVPTVLSGGDVTAEWRFADGNPNIWYGVGSSSALPDFGFIYSQTKIIDPTYISDPLLPIGDDPPPEVYARTDVEIPYLVYTVPIDIIVRIVIPLGAGNYTGHAGLPTNNTIIHITLDVESDVFLGDWGATPAPQPPTAFFTLAELSTYLLQPNPATTSLVGGLLGHKTIAERILLGGASGGSNYDSTVADEPSFSLIFNSNIRLEDRKKYEAIIDKDPDNLNLPTYFKLSIKFEDSIIEEFANLTIDAVEYIINENSSTFTAVRNSNTGNTLFDTPGVRSPFYATGYPFNTTQDDEANQKIGWKTQESATDRIEIKKAGKSGYLDEVLIRP